MFGQKKQDPEFKYLGQTIQYWKTDAYLKKLHRTGCSPNDISELENELKGSLPIAYKEYALWCGSDINGIFTGSEASIHDVMGNNDALNEVLIEEELSHFSNEKFVCFLSHQGYQYYWFYLSDAPDPICYIYLETDESTEFVEAGKFSELFHKLVQRTC